MATVRNPNSAAARNTRTAISPRFATNSDAVIVPPHVGVAVMLCDAGVAPAAARTDGPQPLASRVPCVCTIPAHAALAVGRGTAASNNWYPPPGHHRSEEACANSPSASWGATAAAILDERDQHGR